MSTNNRINKFISRFPNKRTSFIVWELFLGIAISVAVFFNSDQDLNNSERIIKLFSNSFMILVIVGLSRLSINNKYIRKHRYINLIFLIIKIIIIYFTVEYYGYGLNTFLYLIIPFEAYFTTREDIGVISSLLIILLVFVNHKFGESLLEEISLAWTFISLNLLFLILAMFLMRDYQNDQQKSNLLEKLQQSHRLLEEYARNVAKMTIFEERNRIAREIHDSLGHYLTGVNLQLDRASIYLNRDPEEVKEALQAAKLASTEALKDVRSSVSMLRNEDNLFGFQDEVEKIIKGIPPDYQINYHFNGNPNKFNHSVLLVLFRSLQESITNIQKHAQASEITISFDFKESTCTFCIQDNGNGFDPSQINSQNSFGIAGIKERVELVQGDITIQSAPSTGTSIKIIVPADPVLKLSESRES